MSKQRNRLTEERSALFEIRFDSLITRLKGMLDRRDNTR